MIEDDFPVSVKVVRYARWVVQVFASLPTILPAAGAAVAWLAGQLGADSTAVRYAAALLAALTVVAEAASVAQRRGWIKPALRYLDDVAGDR
jgi:hypothetical protein